MKVDLKFLLFSRREQLFTPRANIDLHQKRLKHVLGSAPQDLCRPGSAIT